MTSRTEFLWKRNWRIFERMIFAFLRRRIVWLCVILILLGILYLVANNPSYSIASVKSVHDDKIKYSGNSLGAEERKESRFRILTITGRSYESKISHLKVYRCNATNNVFRPKPSEIRWNNKYWQSPVDGEFFLYSAYYDTRVRKVFRDRHCFVRVLGMHDGPISKKYYCQIWLRNLTRPVVVDADFTEIWFSGWDNQSQRRNYKPFIISCTLPRKFGKLKHFPAIYVSITTKPCKNATTLLEAQQGGIRNVAEGNRTKASPNFVVCVKPLDFAEDLSSRLVEWIELNLILGASRIDFYKFRVHPNVDKVLSYYSRIGKALVIPITLPGNQPNFPIERTQYLQRNLWQKRRDELIPYNDCLYRNVDGADYVIPLDTDEILIPKEHKNWTSMFKHLQKVDGDKIKSFASFSVRNVYYLESFLNKSSDKWAGNTSSELYFMRNVQRSANFSKPGKSVKSFVKTSETLSVFNHYALETVIPGVGRSTVLPVELVQMNHYRSKCPPTMSTECKTNFLKFQVTDNVLHKYKDLLEKNVQMVKKIVKIE